LFSRFFYALREKGIPVTPGSFLRLQQALRMGLILCPDDLYTAARTILIKSERHFDAYDQIFAAFFHGIALNDPEDVEIGEALLALLEEWLKRPEDLAAALGISGEELSRMTPEELVEYFLRLLEEQKEAHHGGNRWIGTGGTAPAGHSGVNSQGMRVGGSSRGRSAVKVALERRYRDYSQEGPITELQMGEALKRLRRLIPAGPRDQVNVEATIRATTGNGGEIEIVFDRRLADRLKVILMIDNGGWSMDPYVDLVQTLFNYARFQFKDLKIYYFHNTIYNFLWEDPSRLARSEPVEDFSRKDPETRLVIVGDASMAPYELLQANGSIYVAASKSRPSIERLRFLAETFRHSVWLNPQPEGSWADAHTVGVVREIFPMFELTMDGLEKAVAHLLKRH